MAAVLKLIMWVAAFYLAVYLFFKVFGPFLRKRLMKFIVKKAQEDLNRQTRAYEQYAEGYSPFEDNVFIDDETKVSIKKEQQVKKEKPHIDPEFIEEVDFEDID